jgi:hypothetical protein
VKAAFFSYGCTALAVIALFKPLNADVYLIYRYALNGTNHTVVNGTLDCFTVDFFNETLMAHSGY